MIGSHPSRLWNGAINPPRPVIRLFSVPLTKHQGLDNTTKDFYVAHSFDAKSLRSGSSVCSAF